jgi:hypothetical protein
VHDRAVPFFRGLVVKVTVGIIGIIGTILVVVQEEPAAAALRHGLTKAGERGLLARRRAIASAARHFPLFVGCLFDRVDHSMMILR